MLSLNRGTGSLTFTTIAALPNLLEAGDVLVINNTRVFPARLIGRRVPSGGVVECLLIGRVGGERWEALVHPGQKLKPGAQMVFEGTHLLRGEVLDRRFHGRRLVRLWTDAGVTVDEAVDAIGHVPLPPYIKRDDCDAIATAINDLRTVARIDCGARLACISRPRSLPPARLVVWTSLKSLHVGYGTFQPVRAPMWKITGLSRNATDR